jgi:hypothetical protein
VELAICVANCRDLIPNFQRTLSFPHTEQPSSGMVVMGSQFIMFAQEKSPHVCSRALMAWFTFLMYWRQLSILTLPMSIGIERLYNPLRLWSWCQRQ